MIFSLESDLCRGITFSIFRASRSIPELNEQFIIAARTWAIIGTKIFTRVGLLNSYLGEIPFRIYLFDGVVLVEREFS